MGRITTLLDEGFCERTAMYVGDRDFVSVRSWLGGFDYANVLAFPNEVSDLKGFREWLLLRIGGPSCYGWDGIIQEKYGTGSDATDHFLELFLSFREDVEARGLKVIFKEHYDYEIVTYGGPCTSEYYSRGWHKT